MRKITLERYNKLKSKLLVKTFSEKYKVIDTILYVFSWFGNFVSIFLAYFFVHKLFASSFKDVADSLFVVFGIIVFLILFELLIRYVFGMFSLEVIKLNFKLLKKELIIFIVSSLVLVSGSFYLSLSGAREFVDNQTKFETNVKTDYKIKIDSLNEIFETKKSPYQEENVKLKKYNDDLRLKLNSSEDLNKYQKIIDKNNEVINTNDGIISKIELDKNNEIEKITFEQQNVINDSSTNNNKNIFSFVLISFFIELIIIIGIFYDKYYSFRVIEEYEISVINSTEFKKWVKYDKILDLIYSTTKNIGDRIPIGDTLFEMADVNNIDISKPEFEKFIKVLYGLDILVKEGKYRLLNKKQLDGKLLLRNYFKII